MEKPCDMNGAAVVVDRLATTDSPCEVLCFLNSLQAAACLIDPMTELFVDWDYKIDKDSMIPLG